MGNNKKFKTYVFQGLLFCLIVVFCMGFTKTQNDYAGSYYGKNLEYTIGESLATVKGGKWETQNGLVRFIIPASEFSWRYMVYAAKEGGKELASNFGRCASGSMFAEQSIVQCLDNTLGQILTAIGADAKIKYNPKNAGKIRELVFAIDPKLKSGLSSSDEQERGLSIFVYAIVSTSAVAVADILNPVEKKNLKPLIMEFEDGKDNKITIKHNRGKEFDEFVSEAFLGSASKVHSFSEVKAYYFPIYEVALKINAMK